MFEVDDVIKHKTWFGTDKDRFEYHIVQILGNDRYKYDVYVKGYRSLTRIGFFKLDGGWTIIKRGIIIDFNEGLKP